MTPTERRLAQARGVLAKARSALAASRVDEARHRGLAAEARTAAKAARAARAEEDAEVLALTGALPDGADAPDPGAARDRVAAGHERAADKVAARRPALEDAVRRAEEALSDSVLSYMRPSRDAALADLRTAIEGLAGPLARLLAAEAVRDALLPTPYHFDPARHPPVELWSGQILAETILAALPARAEPLGLAAGVRSEARALAANIMQKTESPE